MKKKIIGIFICMLLTITALPASGFVNIKTMDNNLQDNISSIENIELRKSNIPSDWLEQAKLIASDGEEGDIFGHSVAIDGDYAIVGAYKDNDNGYWSGSSYIFKRTGSTWAEESKLTASDGEPYDSFGHSVSIDGDIAFVGSLHENNWTGKTYVFKRTGSTWTEMQNLTASDGTYGDAFGVSISIDGDYAIIGAYTLWEIGSAYIFKRSGDTWEEEAILTASDGEIYDHFGISVSIDGDYAIVGAYWDNSKTGSAYIYKRSGTTWTQEAKLTASDGAPDDLFGYCVSIDGEYVAIGSAHDDSDTGSVYIFKRSGTTWTQEAKLTASDGEPDDRFGFCVSIDGEYTAIGAYRDDSEMGSVYVFKLSGTTWTQEAKLTASDGIPPDRFGFSIDIDGYSIITGASSKDSGTGAAYVFEKETECCIEIVNVTGGLLASPPSLKVKANIKNSGNQECLDGNWSFEFSGGIILSGANSGTGLTILPGKTVKISSKVVIGLSIPGILPCRVIVKADSSNNECPEATMSKELLILGLLLKVT